MSISAEMTEVDGRPCILAYALCLLLCIKAYVIRDGTAVQITEYARSKPPMAFMHIVSGPVQNRDHFIIATTRLLRSMTPAQLAQPVQHGGFQTLVPAHQDGEADQDQEAGEAVTQGVDTRKQPIAKALEAGS